MWWKLIKLYVKWMGRLKTAMHVLRGRPAVVGLQFPDGIYLPPGTKHLVISGCEFRRKKPTTLLIRQS